MPGPVVRRDRLYVSGPVRENDVQLLPVVLATFRARRTRVPEAGRLFGKAFDPVAVPMQLAAGADERERKGHVSDVVGNLEGEIAEADAHGVVADDPSVHRQVERNDVSEIGA